MDTTVPITEAEMRDFFQRVTTAFVSLSKQSQELSELRGRFDGMSEELANLRTTNSRLITERDSAISKELEHEQALTDARKGNDYLAERVHALNAQITGRDARVQEVEGLLTSAKLAHEDEQRAHESTKGRAQELENTLSSVRDSRNQYQDRAEKAETELKAVQEKLTAIESQLGTILGLAKPAPVQEAVQEVVEAVKEATSTPDPTVSSVGSSGSEQPSQPLQPVPEPSSSTGPVTTVYEPPKAEPDNRPWWEKSAAQ